MGMSVQKEVVCVCIVFMPSCVSTCVVECTAGGLIDLQSGGSNRYWLEDAPRFLL